jgi:hypothetical protein
MRLNCPGATGQRSVTAWAARAVDARLVDRAPHAGKVAELVDHAMHEWHERSHSVGRRPSALAYEPQRVREVMQCDHREDSLLAHLPEHVAVVPDLPRVERALRGFDARPLDGEPVRVLIQLPEQ